MNNRLIIFDLDGTLLDTLDDIKNAINYALNEHGFKANYTKKDAESFIGSGEYMLVVRSLMKFNESFNEEVIKKVRSTYNKYYSLNCLNETIPFDGVISTLEILKQIGFRLAIFSNKPNAEAKKVAQHFFNDGLFDIIRGSLQNIPVKPNIEGLKLLLKELNIIDTSNVYYVGDSKVDMETGKNMQLKTIAVSYGYEKLEILKSYEPISIIDSFEDILKII